MLETALAAGICSMGADVMLCGPLPTPGIAFITSSMRADAGVVISASHNPYQDNGIKIFAADGFKLPDEVEAEIEELMAVAGARRSRGRTAGEIGKATKIEDSRGRYVVFLKSAFPQRAARSTGCASWSTAPTAPPTRSRRRCSRSSAPRSIALGVKPDGKNINDDCGALHPEKMCAAVQKHGAQLGIALDGDADRVILADEHGDVVDGDAIMAICARRMLERKELQEADARRDGDVEPRPRARDRGAGRQAGAHRRSAIATSSRRCAPTATTSAASSRATWCSSTTRPPATASLAALQVLAVMARERASRCRSCAG